RMAAISVAALAGCTRPAPDGLARLDQPALVTAAGARAPSEVTFYRQGALDPTTSLIRLAVVDANLQMVSTADQASVQALRLELADVDLTPTGSMPDGIKLRHQALSITRAMRADVLAKDPNALNTRAHGSLTYSASLELSDGSLYKLGDTETTTSAL